MPDQLMLSLSQGGSLGRCVACEGPLIIKPDAQHIEPARQCVKADCPKCGQCLTCLMLVEWYREVDYQLDASTGSTG